MKLLIAAACVVIIASGGWYGWSEWQDAKAEAAELAWREREARNLELLEAKRKKRECDAYIAAWDAGQQSRVRDEFGDFADEIVENCRYMIHIWNRKLGIDPS